MVDNLKTFEDLKPMIRPTGVQNGVMKVDKTKCISCGLCIQNCPFKCWEMGMDNYPKMKKDCICFSCYNCMIPCPAEAVSIQETFQIKDGFFATDTLEIRMPLEPKNANNALTQWTETERFILERRSVRNFKKKPVAEPLIRRILEAGRFAPSAGNHQPWKFIVITDPEFINQIEEAVHASWVDMYKKFTDDQTVMNLVNVVPTGTFDPRVQNGIKCVAQKELPIFFNAPVVILIACNEKMANPDLHIGICGQNMNLAAMALGIGCCWSSFASGINRIPELKEKLGIGDSWIIRTSLCLGHPKFKQQGLVPRHYRPVTWFRSDNKGVEQVEL